MGVHQMAMKIIIINDEGNQEEISIDKELSAENWEEYCYQVGCEVAKKVAGNYLKRKDDEILKS